MRYSATYREVAHLVALTSLLNFFHPEAPALPLSGFIVPATRLHLGARGFYVHARKVVADLLSSPSLRRQRQAGAVQCSAVVIDFFARPVMYSMDLRDGLAKRLHSFFFWIHFLQHSRKQQRICREIRLLFRSCVHTTVLPCLPASLLCLSRPAALHCWTKPFPNFHTPRPSRSNRGFCLPCCLHRMCRYVIRFG